MPSNAWAETTKLWVAGGWALVPCPEMQRFRVEGSGYTLVSSVEHVLTCPPANTYPATKKASSSFYGEKLLKRMSGVCPGAASARHPSSSHTKRLR